jgi:epoxide hydrolase 4
MLGSASMATLGTPGLRDGYADFGAVRLHYVEAGDGPLVVLLHGFPEFWYAWRLQIPALAQAGFRVVAPDLRGYNLSSRPQDVAAYATGRLAGDVHDLIRERGADRAFLAGHDWGGFVAWITAMNHPDVVERVAILNSYHPHAFRRALRAPGQLAKSWYMLPLQPPWLPERLVRLRNWHLLREGFERDARPGAFTPQDIERYVEAWSEPGATTGMINYYRALFRHRSRVRIVTAPALMIWGEHDRYLSAELAEPDRADVPNFEGVIRLPDSSHWVQHDEPERVSQALIEFFAG